MAPTESGDPSRDEGTPPQTTPSDGGDERARALAAIFGTDERLHDARAEADAAAAEQRLAAFFAGAGPTVPAAPATAPPVEPAPLEDHVDEFPAGAPIEVDQPTAPEDEDLFALEDDDFLAYDPDEIFTLDEHEDLPAFDDTPEPAPAPTVPVIAPIADDTADAAPPATVPVTAGIADDANPEPADAEDVSEPVTITGLIAAVEQAPDEPLEETPISPRAAKREAKREAKRAARTAAAVPAGEFASTPRGVRGWGKGAWWAVGISIVLVAVLVGASVYVGQLRAAEAEELRLAVAEFEQAADAADDPVTAMDATYTAYDETVAAARLAADSAGPALAAVAGMSDQAALDAANAAHAALVTLLDTTEPPEPPAEYTPPDTATLVDVDSAERATATAEDHAADVVAVTEEVETATATVTQHVTALSEAQKALGATLPGTAEVLVEENDLADRELRDAVIATAAAVGAAQAAGGSGDPELLAYATAVNALREDQQRAEEAAQARRNTPAPQPTQPQPQPQPQPTTEPQPEPVPPPPTDPIVPAPTP